MRHYIQYVHTYLYKTYRYGFLKLVSQKCKKVKKSKIVFDSACLCTPCCTLGCVAQSIPPFPLTTLHPLSPLLLPSSKHILNERSVLPPPIFEQPRKKNPPKQGTVHSIRLPSSFHCCVVLKLFWTRIFSLLSQHTHTHHDLKSQCRDTHQVQRSSQEVSVAKRGLGVKKG